jgi:TolB protein
MTSYKRVFLLFSLTLLFFMVTVEPSYGIVYIDIDSPTIQKFPIAIADFRNLGQEPDKENLGALFADQMGKTLQLTGFFNILPKNAFLEDPKQSGITTDTIRFSDWISIGAESLIKGGFQLNGKDLNAEFRLFDVIQGKLLAGKRYTGKASDRKEMVLNFASEVMLQLTGEKGIFDTKIAFIGKNGSTSEIYAVNFDGSNLTKITDYRSLTLLPRWSPNGRQMTFTSYRDGNPDLYLFDLDKRSVRKISSIRGLNLAASWSADGKKILMTLSKEGNQDIYAMDLQEGKTKRLTSDDSINVSPAWSPNGGKIAFVSDRSGSPQIFIMGADGGNPRRLTYKGNYNTSPAWCPKGKRIAFEGLSGGAFQIFTMDEDGSNLIQLTVQGRNESPSWSPDGRYIAFTSKTNGRQKLCVMNANGSNVRVLHDGMPEYSNTAWSPRSNLY